MSNEAREKADRIALNKASVARAKALLARIDRGEALERRDPPPPSNDDPWDNSMYVSWRGQKFKIQKQQYRDEDVILDSNQKKPR